MRTKRNHRSSLIVVLSLVLLMAMLTACSSATVEETKVSETVTTKEEVAEVEVAEVESEPTPEATAEPTPKPTIEPTPEPTPIVYEGIDMESTLPGAEWVDSFSGIINEPKLVVYNDTTNKKIILEESQKVEFAKDDVLAIYSPTGEASIKELDYNTFSSAKFSNMSIGLNDVSDYWWGMGKATSNNIVEYNGEEVTLSCTLVFTE